MSKPWKFVYITTSVTASHQYPLARTNICSFSRWLTWLPKLPFTQRNIRQLQFVCGISIDSNSNSTQYSLSRMIYMQQQHTHTRNTPANTGKKLNLCHKNVEKEHERYINSNVLCQKFLFNHTRNASIPLLAGYATNVSRLSIWNNTTRKNYLMSQEHLHQNQSASPAVICGRSYLPEELRNSKMTSMDSDTRINIF